MDIRWSKGDARVAWTFEGQTIELHFGVPPCTVAWIESPGSVVVVEALGESAPYNAVVYNPDGSERLRLIPPRLHEVLGFYQVFQSRDDVVAVVSTRQADFWGVPDLMTGELANVHEWR